MAEFSLRKMAAGGMYDHVGGGFHRYSVDEFWHVPHFEKVARRTLPVKPICHVGCSASLPAPNTPHNQGLVLPDRK